MENPRVRFLSYMKLYFPICVMDMIKPEPTPEGWYEDKVNIYKELRTMPGM